MKKNSKIIRYFDAIVTIISVWNKHGMRSLAMVEKGNNDSQSTGDDTLGRTKSALALSDYRRFYPAFSPMMMRMMGVVKLANSSLKHLKSTSIVCCVAKKKSNMVSTFVMREIRVTCLIKITSRDLGRMRENTPVAGASSARNRCTNGANKRS